jgi:hypothetical protein
MAKRRLDHHRHPVYSYRNGPAVTLDDDVYEAPQVLVQATGKEWDPSPSVASLFPGPFPWLSLYQAHQKTFYCVGQLVFKFFQEAGQRSSPDEACQRESSNRPLDSGGQIPPSRYL